MKPPFNKKLPGFLIKSYQKLERRVTQRLNRDKTTEEVFTEIYKRKRWGKGSGEQFNSGPGSTERQIVLPYLSIIETKANEENFYDTTFVDLGCGDFRVGKQLLPFCSKYIAVDIVKPVIQNNIKHHGNEKVRFLHMNIIEEELPEGDVCFLRQVLQHLSNKQIHAVLDKLDKYKWVFITEHHPSDNPHIIPNKDKAQGQHVRVYNNSGVYLSESPFNLDEKKLDLILEVPGLGLGEGNDQGLIRTWLYKP